MEGSFPDAANNHGFKWARWRRLWRRQIQDYLRAATQNIRVLRAGVVLRLAANTAVVLWAGGSALIGLDWLSCTTCPVLLWIAVH